MVLAHRKKAGKRDPVRRPLTGVNREGRTKVKRRVGEEADGCGEAEHVRQLARLDEDAVEGKGGEDLIHCVNLL